MIPIHTMRLVLEHWDGNQESVATMVRWLNDPEVVRFSEQRHRLHDQESQRQYLADGPDVFRLIYAQEQGKFIGTVSAYIDRPNKVANVGIMIGDKTVWGQGYGSEAWAGFCNSLFDGGIRKIEAGCVGLNSPMVGLARRYGMKIEGAITDHFLFEGRPTDMLLFGRFNEAV